uniref:SOWAHA-C winged helix-turn-helix domain-containing protein n=1 Tax=Phlebotomus papatasi TaxID=29031 RepID=A0A1B0DL44_PHLPP
MGLQRQPSLEQAPAEFRRSESQEDPPQVPPRKRSSAERSFSVEKSSSDDSVEEANKENLAIMEEMMEIAKTESENKISVKEATKKFNRIASEEEKIISPSSKKKPEKFPDSHEARKQFKTYVNILATIRTEDKRDGSNEKEKYLILKSKYLHECPSEDNLSLASGSTPIMSPSTRSIASESEFSPGGRQPPPYRPPPIVSPGASSSGTPVKVPILEPQTRAQYKKPPHCNSLICDTISMGIFTLAVP